MTWLLHNFNIQMSQDLRVNVLCSSAHCAGQVQHRFQVYTVEWFVIKLLFLWIAIGAIGCNSEINSVKSCRLQNYNIGGREKASKSKFKTNK